MNQDEKLHGRSPPCITLVDKAIQVLLAILPKCFPSSGKLKRFACHAPGLAGATFPTVARTGDRTRDEWACKS
jgi:hypothetical protein